MQAYLRVHGDMLSQSGANSYMLSGKHGGCMALYVLKAWADDEQGTLIIDDLIEATNNASAIEVALSHPIPLGMGPVKRAELRDSLSSVIWSLPPDA